MAKVAVAITVHAYQLLHASDTHHIVNPAQLKAMMIECTSNLADALALADTSCRDLSQKREDVRRLNLPPESAGICAPLFPLLSGCTHMEQNFTRVWRRPVTPENWDEARRGRLAGEVRAFKEGGAET